MNSLFRLLALNLILFVSCVVPLYAQNAVPAQPIRIKVVVVTMFERGEDTGDTPGEFQLWVEREHLDRVVPLPVRLSPCPPESGWSAWHGDWSRNCQSSCVGDGSRHGPATRPLEGVLDHRWNRRRNPADVSLGSAVWADHVLDGDLSFEIDARQIPATWPTGYLPLRKGTPYEQPVSSESHGELYTLNPGLVAGAFHLTQNVPLADSETLRKFRARFAGFPNR